MRTRLGEKKLDAEILRLRIQVEGQRWSGSPDESCSGERHMWVLLITRLSKELEKDVGNMNEMCSDV